MIRFFQWLFWSVLGCLGYILATIAADWACCLLSAPKWWGKNLAMAIPAATVILYLFLLVGPVWWLVRMSYRKGRRAYALLLS